MKRHHLGQNEMMSLCSENFARLIGDHTVLEHSPLDD